MFRSALFAASRVAVRPAIAVAPRGLLATPARVAPIAIRSYSAAAGLGKEEVEGRIMSLLQGFDKVSNPEHIKPTAHFANDLGLDSLDTVEVVMAIEEEFSIEIPDKEADSIHSVDKAVDYIVQHPDAK
ncbi:mitochondrial acyl carrier protein [Ceratocystis pirilliformis]|uniref:Acyl carrier protein n=1 Tax=Ceratocystis pirilliformis TaxID=259994 RepID=A0ABR3ZL28_9PEZI